MVFALAFAIGVGGWARGFVLFLSFSFSFSFSFFLFSLLNLFLQTYIPRNRYPGSPSARIPDLLLGTRQSSGHPDGGPRGSILVCEMPAAHCVPKLQNRPQRQEGRR